MPKEIDTMASTRHRRHRNTVIDELHQIWDEWASPPDLGISGFRSTNENSNENENAYPEEAEFVDESDFVDLEGGERQHIPAVPVARTISFDNPSHRLSTTTTGGVHYGNNNKDEDEEDDGVVIIHPRHAHRIIRATAPRISPVKPNHSANKQSNVKERVEPVKTQNPTSPPKSATKSVPKSTTKPVSKPVSQPLPLINATNAPADILERARQRSKSGTLSAGVGPKPKQGKK